MQEDGIVAPINKHDWLSFARRVELVLLHEASCKAPSGTLAWLKLRPGLVRHHHVRLNENKDVSRLCRWIAGKAVGLVLSGALSLRLLLLICVSLCGICLWELFIVCKGHLSSIKRISGEFWTNLDLPMFLQS